MLKQCPTCLFLTISVHVCAALYRGLVDDGSFHEACEKVQQEEVPYFHQFSTAKLPKDRISSTSSSSDLSPAPSPPRCDSRTSAARDIPAVSLTLVYQRINPFKWCVYCCIRGLELWSATLSKHYSNTAIPLHLLLTYLFLLFFHQH